MKDDEWERLAKKLDMLVEEFEAFCQVQLEFEKLENSYMKNLKKRDDLKAELEKTARSEEKVFGFFNKMTKDDLMTELRNKISATERDIEGEHKLLSLATEVIMQVEIPLIKERKRERFDEMVNEFAIARVRKLDEEMEFWERVVHKEDRNAPYDSEIDMNEIVQ
jgi:hypothetical protein